MKNTLLLPLLIIFTTAFGQYSGTPLLLSLPMNQDTIEEDEPVFVWQTTLSNLQTDPRLNVQLAVVKMDEDQTPTEAIIENAPVFIRQNLVSSSLNYSNIDHELEEDTWYAWQVILFYNGVQVQQSEVWKFIKIAEPEPTHTYFSLRTKADNSLVELKEDKFYVTTNEPGDFQLQGVITGKGISTKHIQFVELKTDNSTTNASIQHSESRYFSCDLSELKLKKGDYRIQWDANSSKHFVLFIEKI